MDGLTTRIGSIYFNQITAFKGDGDTEGQDFLGGLLGVRVLYSLGSLGLSLLVCLQLDRAVICNEAPRNCLH